jgi:hypothetical protein
MIKKQQKWIALLVTLAFVWLLQVSTMPLAAAGTAEQVSSANHEQGPRFIEEEGHRGYHAAKKSILPYVLIGVGVVAVAAVLILVVLKTSYNIVGTWEETNTMMSNTTEIVFSGSKSSGTVELTDYIDTGTYTVSSKTVHFEFHATGYNYNFVYDGQFDTKDKMSGTVKYYEGSTVSDQGTWSATRAATTAGSGKLPMAVRSARKVR